MRNITLFIVYAFVTACGTTSGSNSPSTNTISEANTKITRISAPLEASKLTTPLRYPGVEFAEYTLISSDFDRDKADVDAIIAVKTAWTHAMQTKVREDFEKALAKDHTHVGGRGAMSRQEYIENRVSDPSKTKRAVYDNVVLQLFGDTAVLSYVVTVETDPVDPSGLQERMAWTDIIAKEDGEWKIAGTRMTWLQEITNAESKKKP